MLPVGFRSLADPVTARLALVCFEVPSPVGSFGFRPCREELLTHGAGLARFFQAYARNGRRWEAAADPRVIDRLGSVFTRPRHQGSRLLGREEDIRATGGDGEQEIGGRSLQLQFRALVIRRPPRRDQFRQPCDSPFFLPLVDVVAFIDVSFDQRFRRFEEDPAAVVAHVVDDRRRDDLAKCLQARIAHCRLDQRIA